MEKQFPKRKPTRLIEFDYSTNGAYFVTICTKHRKKVLSEIVSMNSIDTDQTIGLSVGEGLAPPGCTVRLKPCGEIAKEQLQLLQVRYSNVRVSDYVIMPDHIHVIIFLHEEAGGASPSPTLNDIICTFKSLTSRICKKQHGIEQIFQRSYADHIIRDKDDYEVRRRYIFENPARRFEKDVLETIDKDILHNKTAVAGEKISGEIS